VNEVQLASEKETKTSVNEVTLWSNFKTDDIISTSKS
jgi:hypothetical protein